MPTVPRLAGAARPASALPLRAECDAQGELAVLRPALPLLRAAPGLCTRRWAAQAPLRLRLRHPEQAHDHGVTLHEWRPDGAAYEGLPEDLDAARRRRAERITVEASARGADAPAMGESPLRASAYAMDLRWLGGAIPA